MKLSEFIINDIKPVNSASKIKDLQLLFNQLTFSHVPVEDDNKTYLGSFSETDAHCCESDKQLLDYRYSFEDFFVRDTNLT